MKAITVKHLAHTETKPCRMKAFDLDGNNITVSCSGTGLSEHSDAHKQQVAQALCDKMGWTGLLVGGDTADAMVFCFVDHSALKIKAVLRIVRPRTYTGEGAFVYTDTLTGKQVQAKTGIPDNIPGVTRLLNGGEWEGNDQPRTYSTYEEIGNRQFEQLTKGWEHIGSQPEEFADYITKQMA